MIDVVVFFFAFVSFVGSLAALATSIGLLCAVLFIKTGEREKILILTIPAKAKLVDGLRRAIYEMPSCKH